eukprot:CAMPEP_0198688728 /NCGR_PEP_ID=MMETSP1468-20131203/119185_1 /TAXON_ID=1461545 /ORGANISM="Mantoniella sp, Strain CCMP1436" /LENGTH=241 /DNA_ID=CAMNT_0044438897 /DNA_START=122 /DNA_END=849 /DNA_ORIENTATION=-
MFICGRQPSRSADSAANFNGLTVSPSLYYTRLPSQVTLTYNPTSSLLHEVEPATQKQRAPTPWGVVPSGPASARSLSTFYNALYTRFAQCHGVNGRRGSRRSPAALVQHHGLLHDELALLVFLARFVGGLVFPSHEVATRRAEHVADRVQARHEHAVFLATQRDVGHVVEEVRASVAPLECLGHDVVVIGAVAAAEEQLYTLLPVSFFGTGGCAMTRRDTLLCLDVAKDRDDDAQRTADNN